MVNGAASALGNGSAVAEGGRERWRVVAHFSVLNVYGGDHTLSNQTLRSDDTMGTQLTLLFNVHLLLNTQIT